MLLLCENLHCTFSSSGTTGTGTSITSSTTSSSSSSSSVNSATSLRLLVPVHQSLCQAVVVNAADANANAKSSATAAIAAATTTTTTLQATRNNVDVNNKNSTQKLQTFITQDLCHFHTQDAELCCQILFSSQDATTTTTTTTTKTNMSRSIMMMKQLAVLQCLLVLLHNKNNNNNKNEEHNSSYKRPLKGLIQIILPWLMEYLPQQYYQYCDWSSTTSTGNKQQTTWSNHDSDEYKSHNSSSGNGGGNDSNHHFSQHQQERIPQDCLDFAEAILDAVFANVSTAGTTTTAAAAAAADQDSDLQDCIDFFSLHNYYHNRYPEWVWTIQGRVLMRLHKSSIAAAAANSDNAEGQCDSNMATINTHSKFIMQALTNTCRQAIQSSLLSPSLSSSFIDEAAQMSQMVAWLRPMTMEWLPYWIENVCTMMRSNSDAQAMVDQLWHCLWDAYHSSSLTNNAVVTLVSKTNTNTFSTALTTNSHHTPVPLSILSTTSILCTIIPALLERELPLITKYSTTSTTPPPPPQPHDNWNGTDDPDPNAQRARPTHQVCLWELIHTCLRQGIPRPFKTEKARLSEQTVHQQSQMLRRRGLFLLRMILPSGIVMDAESAPSPTNESSTSTTTAAAAAAAIANDGTKKKKKKTKGGTDGGGNGGKQRSKTSKSQKIDPHVLLWKQYVQVMETLEMETQQHLIEQVWDTLCEIMTACHAQQQQQQQGPEGSNTGRLPPTMTWHWAKLLLSRVLTSYEEPIIRKLALYRLLNGQAGILLHANSSSNNDVNTAIDGSDNESSRTKKIKPNKKGKTAAAAMKGAPLSILTPDFLCEIVVTAFDSLLGGVGTNLHQNENNQVKRVQLTPLLSQFLTRYYLSLESADRVIEFMSKVWYGSSLMVHMRTKTVLLVWEALAKGMIDKGSILEVDSSMLENLVSSLHQFFSMSSVTRLQHEAFLQALATMLRYTKTTTTQVDPKVVLQILALFDSIVLETKRGTASSADAPEDDTDELQTLPIHVAIKAWLYQLGDTKDGHSKWIEMVASTVSAAYVRGDLLSLSGDERSSWEPVSSASKTEREFARAIAYLGALVGATDTSKPGTGTTASELLWPAIHKGVANVPVSMVGTAWSKADCVTRALLLLEEGCRLQLLSGMGNGDLIVDKKTQQMMPPPPNIESILANSVKFILYHISFLVTENPSKKELAGATRSGGAKKVSVTFANLVSQIIILHKAYPSSMAISEAVNEMLGKSIDQLPVDSSKVGIDGVRSLALVYAALSCGASLPDSVNLVGVCRSCLLLEFQKSPEQKKSEEQVARSIFHFAKWGTLSCLLPILLTDKERETSSEAVDEFLHDFRKVAFDAVHGIPVDAMMAFFHCMKVAGKKELSQSPQGEEGDPDLVGDYISAMMALMEESTKSKDSVYFLNELCVLIFNPKLLLQEYERLMKDPVAGATPIRDAFRKLMILAGTMRSHIAKVVLCRVTAGWLEESSPESDIGKVGLGAIPFRNDIVELTFYKEAKYDNAASNQTIGRGENLKGAFDLPAGIDDSSIGRGYLLMFLSCLPDLDKVHPRVLNDLIHYVIFKLLDKVCPEEGTKPNLVMLGSEDYINKIRGWQALCVLSRFVTDDIANQVCEYAFRAMAEPLHSQIRYFIEIFTLQCSRNHPSVFGKAILKTITRRDLSLTHVTSVMIIAGNLIVGRYKQDFFTQFEEGTTREAVPLNNVLAGIIPWLGSTQGFSRGIAQLLTHVLIPMVVDVTAPDPSKEISITDQSDWFLLSIYRFLDENPEMKRLRNKQANFFEQYDADKSCTAEGILTIPVDEGGEAFPTHMVDVMKQCQKETYDQAEEMEYPQWKHIEEMMTTDGGGRDEKDNGCVIAGNIDDLVNFQRKIIPIDELNLAMETLREKRLRNVAGRRKQDLVVCASLIDKVPNLGGLTRTAEIFAAKKLIIPDLGVTKMDNFKNFSASAGDWIDIEECKEEVRVFAACICIGNGAE